MNGTTRFRYAVVFLIVVAYALVAVSFAYGDMQLREGRQLECTIAAAQIAIGRAALAAPGQPRQLQAARREAVTAWQLLSRRYGCGP